LGRYPASPETFNAFCAWLFQEELKRRSEVEKVARERAKAKAQRDEQERTSRAVAGVNHLEIPAELAFIFSKLDGKALPRALCTFHAQVHALSSDNIPLSLQTGSQRTPSATW
jgi:hypothetical protein